MLILITALDTTWRAFAPLLLAVFAGIWLDHLFGSAPVFVIVCLGVGALASAYLIIKQLRTVQGKSNS